MYLSGSFALCWKIFRVLVSGLFLKELQQYDCTKINALHLCDLSTWHCSLATRLLALLIQSMLIASVKQSSASYICDFIFLHLLLNYSIYKSLSLSSYAVSKMKRGREWGRVVLDETGCQPSPLTVTKLVICLSNLIYLSNLDNISCSLCPSCP